MIFDLGNFRQSSFITKFDRALGRVGLELRWVIERCGWDIISERWFLRVRRRA